MKPSTKDKVQGGFREAKGKIKEQIGKATEDPNMRDRGTAEKLAGKVQRKVGDVERKLWENKISAKEDQAFNIKPDNERGGQRFIDSCAVPSTRDYFTVTAVAVIM